MISLGVWACRYRELRPISFGGGGGVGAQAGTDGQKDEGGQEEPTSGEHVRGGRGRGRNRDDGPSYEMLAVGEDGGEAV